MSKKYSVFPAIQEALDIFQDFEDRWDLVNRIQAVDPFHDKRFTPVIARWVVGHRITPQEHAKDVADFKSLRKRLKDLHVPATNRERTKKIKDLRSKKPHDFAAHYSLLQDWNRKASDILDPEKDLSDEGLPVEMRHDGYTMYRIETMEHCKIPLVTNTMSWCVTKTSFDDYSGPPYYPIVRDYDKKPFCMIVPAHFDKDPDQAVRNSQNDGRLSSADLAKIRPLVQHILPLDKYKHPYINGVHGIKISFPDKPSPEEALRIIKDYAVQSGEWEEGEDAIAQDPQASVDYAQYVLKGRFLKGEETVSQSARWSHQYALYVIRGPFPLGEDAISKEPQHAYWYAVQVLKAPFALGEKVIGQDAGRAVMYAQEILKGPFPLGEQAISNAIGWVKSYEEILKKYNAKWSLKTRAR